MAIPDPTPNRFVSSLDEIATYFGVSTKVVIGWRDDDHCWVLEKGRPYDLKAIEQWLDKRSDVKLDDEMCQRKYELELRIKDLERKGDFFSSDKTFWLAALALGIALSKEVREWLNIKPTQKKETVLWIGNDIHFTSLYIPDLQKCGFYVETAESVVQAIDYYTSNRPIDILLIDISMPLGPLQDTEQGSITGICLYKHLSKIALRAIPSTIFISDIDYECVAGDLAQLQRPYGRAWRFVQINHITPRELPFQLMSQLGGSAVLNSK